MAFNANQSILMDGNAANIMYSRYSGAGSGLVSARLSSVGATRKVPVGSEVTSSKWAAVKQRHAGDFRLFIPFGVTRTISGSTISSSADSLNGLTKAISLANFSSTSHTEFTRLFLKGGSITSPDGPKWDDSEINVGNFMDNYTVTYTKPDGTVMTEADAKTYAAGTGNVVNYSIDYKSEAHKTQCEAFALDGSDPLFVSAMRLAYDFHFGERIGFGARCMDEGTTSFNNPGNIMSAFHPRGVAVGTGFRKPEEISSSSQNSLAMTEIGMTYNTTEMPNSEYPYNGSGHYIYNTGGLQLNTSWQTNPNGDHRNGCSRGVFFIAIEFVDGFWKLSAPMDQMWGMYNTETAKIPFAQKALERLTYDLVDSEIEPTGTYRTIASNLLAVGSKSCEVTFHSIGESTGSTAIPYVHIGGYASANGSSGMTVPAQLTVSNFGPRRASCLIDTDQSSFPVGLNIRAAFYDEEIVGVWIGDGDLNNAERARFKVINLKYDGLPVDGTVYTVNDSIDYGLPGNTVSYSFTLRWVFSRETVFEPIKLEDQSGQFFVSLRGNPLLVDRQVTDNLHATGLSNSFYTVESGWLTRKGSKYQLPPMTVNLT